MSKISRDKKKKEASKKEAIQEAVPAATAKLVCQLCSHYRKSEPCAKRKEHVARKQPACKSFKRKGS